MRSRLLGAAAAALLLVAAVAGHAQEARTGPYGGVVFSQLRYDQSGADTASLSNLGGTLGLVMSPHWALEARMGFGLDDDRINVGPAQVDVELDYYLSALAKGILPLAPRFAVYGLAGFTIGKFRAGNPALVVDKWESDFTYGAGVELGFLPSASLTLEWQRMFDRSGYNLDAASIGVNFRF